MEESTIQEGRDERKKRMVTITIHFNLVKDVYQ